MNEFDFELENLLKELADYSYNNSLMKTAVFHADQVDLSTNFDQEIEDKLSLFLKAKYPDYGVLGEEGQNYLKDSDYVWVIDPIDGTKYFHKDIPLWSSTVALLHKGVAEYGLCYYPSERTLFKAIKGRGFFRNDINIGQKLNKKKQISQSMIMLQANNVHPEVKKIIGELFEKFYRVRVLGSSALALSWLAQGGFDAYVNLTEKHEKIMDSMAGLLFVEESGGKILRYNNKFGSETYIAGTPNLVNEIVPMINTIIKNLIS